MPLWNVYHPVALYTEQDKYEFAEQVTRVYESGGLPRFYVAVLFHEVGSQSCYAGGEAADDFVRITIAHLARHFEDPEDRARVGRAVSAAIEPFTTGKSKRRASARPVPPAPYRPKAPASVRNRPVLLRPELLGVRARDTPCSSFSQPNGITTPSVRCMEDFSPPWPTPPWDALCTASSRRAPPTPPLTSP